MLNLFDKMIEVAPTLDVTTRCKGSWGEPDYPSEPSEEE